MTPIEARDSELSRNAGTLGYPVPTTAARHARDPEGRGWSEREQDGAPE